MRLRLLGISLLAAGMFISGCAKNNEPVATTAPAAAVLTAPTPHVKGLMDKFQLQNVDYAYVKQAIGNGTRGGAKALLIVPACIRILTVQGVAEGSNRAAPEGQKIVAGGKREGTAVPQRAAPGEDPAIKEP